MSGARDYIIPFGVLTRGEHEFEFEVNDSFFERFENSLIRKGHVDILVVLERKENLLVLDFTLSGTVTLPCDRCLDDLELDLEGYNELLIKFGDHHVEESEDVIVLSHKEHELDLAQFIYEYITIMIPMRNVHEDENGNPACDPETLNEIEKYRSHVDDQPPVDPRWDVLKDINLN